MNGCEVGQILLDDFSTNSLLVLGSDSDTNQAKTSNLNTNSVRECKRTVAQTFANVNTCIFSRRASVSLFSFSVINIKI